METIQHILFGFSVALTPINIWWTFLGALVGTLIGVIPGLGPAATMAILMPLTFNMNPLSALIMMTGIYCGAMYGGSTTSILINMPGENASVMTCIDGYQMAKNGRGGAALAVSAIGSFVSASMAIVALSALATPLTNMALKFGPPEYFALMLFALTSVSMLSGRSFAKGMMSTVLGLMIATVGIDLQSGLSRYTMGILELQTGISFLSIVVGLFGLSEVFKSMEEIYMEKSEPFRIQGKLWLTKEEWRRSIAPIFRGGIIGFCIGVLPGAGAIIATMLSYAVEKRVSKSPEKFGKGAIEGVAAPESANNACSVGAMVPLLTLGVPGSGSMAVIMSAFIMYGINPGPMLFERNPDVVWGLIGSLYAGNVILLILNLPLVGLFTRLLYIPTGIMVTLILGITTVGVYAANNFMWDLYMLLAFGVLGYIFRKIDIPMTPLVLSVVLGELVEQAFRQSMVMSGGNPVIFFGSAISSTFLIMAVFVVVLPTFLPRLKRLVAGA